MTSRRSERRAQTTRRSKSEEEECAHTAKTKEEEEEDDEKTLEERVEVFRERPAFRAGVHQQDSHGAVDEFDGREERKSVEIAWKH